MLQQMTGIRERDGGSANLDLANRLSSTREQLAERGLVRLEGVIPPEWLAAARADVDRYLARHGTGEHSLTDADEWECPAIEGLAGDGRVSSFLHTLSAFPEDAGPGYGGYRQRVLRILDGSAVDSPPFDWHYDANAVTMLVPIVIPDDNSGLLAMFPDHRPHRRLATVSAAERLLVHSKHYGRRLRTRFEHDPSAHTVPLTPGDAFVFRGYRTLHATLPWPRDTLRVTLLLQYGHPYGPEGRFTQAVRTRRQSIRKRRIGSLSAS
jgi:hypothetical protein